MALHRLTTEPGTAVFDGGEGGGAGGVREPMAADGVAGAAVGRDHE